MNSSPSQGAIAQWLTEKVARLAELPIARVDAATPVVDFGIESLALLGLAGDLAAWLQRDISPTLLWEFPTIAELSAHLSAPCAATRRALVPLQTRGDGPPFYLIHSLHGSLLTYRYLLAHLGEEQMIDGFEVPFGEDEAERIESVEALATLYLAELRAQQPGGPYLLGGYSLGGLLAFEMARQLRAQGETIGALVLIDTMFPGATQRSLLPAERILGGWDRFLVRVCAFPELSPARRRAYLRRHFRHTIARLGRSFSPSDATSPSPHDLLHSPISARLNEVSRRYRPRDFDGSLVYLRATGRSRTASDDIAAWRRVVRGKVRTRRIPGQHENVVFPPNAVALAAQLRRALRHAAT